MADELGQAVAAVVRDCLGVSSGEVVLIFCNLPSGEDSLSPATAEGALVVDGSIASEGESVLGA